ncbi:hypothetical protein VKT23_017097 [Stygiomarasmius scandens]|uniref:Uncharacterized protein n=1 Tax=Marasmiellus scandens TaxID=2682957 RepID=A0ABR1IVF5_9AGAR
MSSTLALDQGPKQNNGVLEMRSFKKIEKAFASNHEYISFLEENNADLESQLTTLHTQYHELHDKYLEKVRELTVEREGKIAWQTHLDTLMKRIVEEGQKFLENIVYDAGQVEVMMEKDNPNQPLRRYYIGGEGKRIYYSDYGDEDSD